MEPPEGREQRAQEPSLEELVEEFLKSDPQAKPLFAAVRQAVARVGDANVRVTRSQIAFRRRRNFALVWRPGQYLRAKTAPLVLTILLRYRDPSPRWKQVIEPATGRFTHHLELFGTQDVDDEVVDWLRRAWQSA